MASTDQSRPPAVKTIYDPQYIALVALLRTRRLELGLTQEELARTIGVRARSICLQFCCILTAAQIDALRP